MSALFTANTIDQKLGEFYTQIDPNKKESMQKNLLKTNLLKYLQDEGYESSDERNREMRDMVNVWYKAKVDNADTLAAIKNHKFFNTEETAPAAEEVPAEKKAEPKHTDTTTEKKAGASNAKTGSTSTTNKKKPASTTTTKKAGTGTKKPTSTKKPAGPVVENRPRTIDEIVSDASAKTNSPKKTKKTPATPKKEEKSKKSFKLTIKPTAVALVISVIALIGVIAMFLSGGNLFPFSQNGNGSGNGGNNASTVEKYDAVKVSTLCIACPDGTKVQLDTACTQDMVFTIDAVVGKTPTIMDDGYGGEAEAIYFYGVDNSVLRITYPVGKSFPVDTLLSGTTVTVKDGVATLKTASNTYTAIPYAQ